MFYFVGTQAVTDDQQKTKQVSISYYKIMPNHKDIITKHVSWIVFIFLAIQTAQVLSAFTDVPPPPKRPERFHSREELKRYLQLV
ncbi:unnamed protein product [Rotaria socialis]